MSLGGAAATAGFLLLFHCTYAVSRCAWLLLHFSAACVCPPTSTTRPADRDLLKLTQQEFSGLPQQLQLELLVSTVLCMIGVAPELLCTATNPQPAAQPTPVLVSAHAGGLLLAGKLKPITFSKGAP
jgi:hypothetical protein